MTFEKKIGNSIREKREMKGITIDSMVQSLQKKEEKATVEKYREIEDGERFVSIPVLQNIAEVLEMQVDALVDWEDDDKSLVELFRERTDELSEEDEIFLGDLEIIAHSLVAQEKMHSKTKEELQEERRLYLTRKKNFD